MAEAPEVGLGLVEDAAAFGLVIPWTGMEEALKMQAPKKQELQREWELQRERELQR